VSIADVEANYAVVRAYQYTNLTSIQLLDCCSIFGVMLLSRVFLRHRFRSIHFVVGLQVNNGIRVNGPCRAGRIGLSCGIVARYHSGLEYGTVSQRRRLQPRSR
jgi:solute carrier family 35 protein F1/2